MTKGRHYVFWCSVVFVAVVGTAAAHLGSVAVEKPVVLPVASEELWESPACGRTDEQPLPALTTAEEAPGSEAACSPPPECWTDRDCNKICGKKVGGKCIVINSCYRICSCNAT